MVFPGCAHKRPFSKRAAWVKLNRAGSGVSRNSLIWQRRPVKPAKQEHVKEGFPVMQSSMHWPPFRHGRRWGHTDAEGTCQGYRNNHKKLKKGLKGVFYEALTRVAAPDFYIRVVYPEDPSARVAHVSGPLHVDHVGGAGAGDVEVALAVAGVKTCLGRE